MSTPDDASTDDPQPGLAARLMQQRRALYSYLYSCTRDSHLAEDLLQEVAQVALESFDQLRDDDKFTPWLFGIARRRVLMHARKAERERSLSPEAMESLAAEAEQVDPKHYLDRQQALTECLAQLTAHARQIIMRRYDGSVASIDELAIQLGRSVQAVYGILKRTRQKLADCVARKLAQAGR